MDFGFVHSGTGLGPLVNERRRDHWRGAGVGLGTVEGMWWGTWEKLGERAWTMNA